MPDPTPLLALPVSPCKTPSIFANMILVLIASLLLGRARLASAIESKCSACKLVAGELQGRLDAEVPRNHLDMRHRLDQEGKRYGKVIEYRSADPGTVENHCEDSGGLFCEYCECDGDHDAIEAKIACVSELRMIELLEDLCVTMKSYTWGYMNPNNGGPLRLDWVLKRKAQDISHGMDKAEEDLRSKQLVAYCGLLVENFEEELISAIRTGFDEETGLQHLLCNEMAEACDAPEQSTDKSEL